MFTPRGRDLTAEVARGFAIPGVAYAFVRGMLHDPRFTAPQVPPSADLMFATVARFMSRLPAERHSPLRARLGGLFTVRRVERYRTAIAERAHRLVDGFVAAGTVDLVPAFARPLPFAIIADVLGAPAGAPG